MNQIIRKLCRIRAQYKHSTHAADSNLTQLTGWHQAKTGSAPNPILPYGVETAFAFMPAEAVRRSSILASYVDTSGLIQRSPIAAKRQSGFSSPGSFMIAPSCGSSSSQACARPFSSESNNEESFRSCCETFHAGGRSDKVIGSQRHASRNLKACSDVRDVFQQGEVRLQRR